MKPKTVIVGLCGFSGSGKTRFCQKIVTELRAEGVQYGGFISPAVFEGTQKTAIKVQWLESGQEWVLMTPVTKESQQTVGRWQIQPEVFERINRNLADLKECQAFFCDEIGPLEVLQGKGWIKALEILDESKFSLNMVTFRPTLREYFTQRYPDMMIIDLEISDDDEKIVRYIKEIFGID